MSSPVVEAPPYHDLAQAAQSRRDNILGIYERWSTVRRLQGQSPISTKAQCKFWSCHKLPPKRGACRRRLVTTTSSFFNSGTYSKPPLEFTSNWTFGWHLIGASMVLLRRKLYSETKYRPFHGPRLSGHQDHLHRSHVWSPCRTHAFLKQGLPKQDIPSQTQSQAVVPQPTIDN